MFKRLGHFKFSSSKAAKKISFLGHYYSKLQYFFFFFQSLADWTSKLFWAEDKITFDPWVYAVLHNHI